MDERILKKADKIISKDIVGTGREIEKTRLGLVLDNNESISRLIKLIEKNNQQVKEYTRIIIYLTIGMFALATITLFINTQLIR